MSCETITIERTALTDDISRALIGALNAELSGMYPEPGANHFRLDPDEVAEGRGVFLVVYCDGTPVGCGALRLIDAQTAELKRMYIAPAMRGKGLGRRLVVALEAEARTLGRCNRGIDGMVGVRQFPLPLGEGQGEGVRRLVLETGIRQTAAVALYRATGFRPIPLYGEYCLSPETSVCLGKDLVNHERG